MSSILSERFVKNLRARMEAENLRQADLAERMGCTQGYISHILTGYRSVGFESVERFAEAFGCDPLQLLAEPCVEKISK